MSEEFTTTPEKKDLKYLEWAQFHLKCKADPKE